MNMKIAGIHHITAIASNPQKNVDFYSGILGLRFLKKTVNFDDPYTYHLYYGDKRGNPGTALTFFPWPSAKRGNKGVGQATCISFSIPDNSIGYWQDRLSEYSIVFEGPVQRFDETLLVFSDPDGIQLELVSTKGAMFPDSWGKGTVPAQYAIGGFYGVTLSVRKNETTNVLLKNVFGFETGQKSAERSRYQSKENTLGSVVDVLTLPDVPFGGMSAGNIHHVAFRVPDEKEQEKWRQKIAVSGYNVTPIIDRNYFKSIYFREHSGVLFELATDSPGFTVDESEENLGTELKLPSWYENQRESIEQHLLKINIPYINQS
jgi:catechol 2,3-dioxygenase-like lactoylglutathione lyase family enzyme